MTAEPGPRIVSFDLMPRDPDYYFVLTEALQEFAARQRAEAEDEADPASRIRWAETAESALERIEEALSTAKPDPVHYRWPAACGDFSSGDLWTGNLDQVTCPACRCPDPGPCVNGPFPHERHISCQRDWD